MTRRSYIVVRWLRPIAYAGLSLVEAIISLSLVGLIILFLLGLLPSSAFVVRRAEQQIAATHYAEEILAELGSLPLESLKEGLGTLTPYAPKILNGVLADRTLSDHTILHPEVVISSGLPAGRVFDVQVAVGWSSKGKEHTFCLSRRYSNVLR